MCQELNRQALPFQQQTLLIIRAYCQGLLLECIIKSLALMLTVQTSPMTNSTLEYAYIGLNHATQVI